MNELKYQLTQFIFLVILGLAAYWALTNLDNGISYTRDNIVQDADLSQEEPDQQANTVNNQIILTALDASGELEVIAEEKPIVETTPASVENSELISAIETLVADGITMDNGDTGSRVGTVQKFLDIYFGDKKVSIDNDFGPTTKGLVRDFQNTELNGGDGRIGPNTLRAMIEYLKK
ncbi:MAG: hypothetical protein ACI870_000511 [Crocinitomicaceae bacterium]|jgi:hypothetical protein